MRLRTTIAWLFIALPLVGAAQGLGGLDLSKPRKQQPAPPPANVDEELPPLPSEPSAAPAAEAKPAEAAPEKKEGGQADLLAIPEGDVALGDRVKAVQRKGFLKRHRFEVTPIFAATVNDAFYQKYGPGLRLAYNFGDSFALAARGAVYQYEPLNLRAYRTDNVREGKIAFRSQLLSSQIYQQLMLDGIWSPIYGKASWLNRDIVHFDLFLVAGFGAVWSATSYAPRNEGAHVAADLGGGIRFYPLEWMAFELGLLATLYPDQPNLAVPGTIQKVFAANIGVSFFLPTRFEYVYP